ncbi:hypothetical protein B0T10DRAFT_304653 [Thelonectria olida]|uniref:C3H1-type domain-containing protein n=1 Tax=Thelonectria olida TaxID=1576542 RepID=A0A9P8W789_9HYPO|nr:hypothetical protein B0T10DRAFT_304653 [Thelonectria olida]
METNWADLVARYQHLQSWQNSSSDLMQDILRYAQNIDSVLREENRILTDKLRDAELDLADAKQGRRDLQQRVKRYDSELLSLSGENDSLKNRNPYIMILVDGDGLLFHEDLIKKGNEGGKIAAAALRASVASIVGDRANELEVIARVVANVSGLGKAMVRDGSLDNQQNFKDFTLGFTQAKASFDFIDVGYGKERADTKIKETTRWHLQNSNCKQILLGISHDAGYAPFLDEILTDTPTRHRVSVLEGYPTVRELRDTRVNIERFSRDIFRTTKLVDKSPTISLPNNGSMNGVHGMLTPATSNASMSPPLSSATAVHAVSEAPTPTPAVAQVPAPVSAPVSVASPAVSSSYANMAAAPSPPPQMHIPLAPKPSAKKAAAAAAAAAPAVPAWVPEPRGLDELIPTVSLQAMETIKRRKEHNKLCNNHYLRGPCTKIDNCLFVHNYKPTRDELRALAMLSRLNPCTRGQDCEVEDCIYGHHCPSFKDNVCTHPYCRFPVEAHPPGCKFKNTKIHEN